MRRARRCSDLAARRGPPPRSGLRDAAAAARRGRWIRRPPLRRLTIGDGHPSRGDQPRVRAPRSATGPAGSIRQDAPVLVLTADALTTRAPKRVRQLLADRDRPRRGLDRRWLRRLARRRPAGATTPHRDRRPRSVERRTSPADLTMSTSAAARVGGRAHRRRTAHAGRRADVALARAAAGRPIATMCEGGYRSSTRGQPARAAGFDHLSNVDGGMSAWRRSKPVTSLMTMLLAGSRLAQYEIVSAIGSGGHGRGLSRARHPARPRRRAQGDGAAHRVRSGDAPPLRDRGPRRRVADPSRHPVDLRAGGRRRARRSR